MPKREERRRRSLKISLTPPSLSPTVLAPHGSATEAKSSCFHANENTFLKKALAIGIGLTMGALPCACTLLTSLDGFDSEGRTLPDSDASTLDSAPPKTNGPTSNEDAPDSEVTLGDARVLATTEGVPAALAIDKDYIYWHNPTGNYGIMRVPRFTQHNSDAGDAGAPTLLSSSDWYRGSVIVAGPKLAISASGGGASSINLLYKTGEGAGMIGPPFTIHTRRLVAYGGTVFAYNDLTMYSGSDQGGIGTLLIQSTPIAHANVDATSIYFASNTNLMRMPKMGADAGLDIIANVGGGVRGMASDLTHLYWIDDIGQVSSIDKTALVGTPKVLASGQAGPSSIALDSTGIFWTNAAGGTVMRMPKAGGEPKVVATDQPNASLIAADDLGVAWLRDGSEVVALSRQ